MPTTLWAWKTRFIHLVFDRSKTSRPTY